MQLIAYCCCKKIIKDGCKKIANYFKRPQDEDQYDGLVIKGQEGVPRVFDGSVFTTLKIPENVKGGDSLHFTVGFHVLKVQCPPHCKTGQLIAVVLPKQPGAANPRQQNHSIFDSPDFPTTHDPNTSAYMVKVPTGTRRGQRFFVSMLGQKLMITSPKNFGPGTVLRILSPQILQTVVVASSGSPTKICGSDPPVYRLTVPARFFPGQHFPVTIGGQIVFVRCPPKAEPGTLIQIRGRASPPTTLDI